MFLYGASLLSKYKQKEVCAPQKLSQTRIQTLNSIGTQPTNQVIPILPIHHSTSEDGRVRICFPILAAWIADHIENASVVHAAKSNACPRCEISLNILGSHMQNGYPTRDYARYDYLK